MSVAELVKGPYKDRVTSLCVCVSDRERVSERSKKSYTGGTKAVSHDEVERSAGLTPVAVHTAAAVVEHFLAQICTLLGLLLEQHVPKLQPNQTS